MSANVLFGPPPATLEVLLEDPDEHDFPAATRILSGLTPAQAMLMPLGLPYSIAQVVAHMLANMKFNLELIEADEPARYRNPYEAWPPVQAEQWPALATEFLATLERLKQLAREHALERVVYPANSDEPAWTVGYKLACSVAKHNAYHLGQIVVLRRSIGAWGDPQ